MAEIHLLPNLAPLWAEPQCVVSGTSSALRSPKFRWAPSTQGCIRRSCGKQNVWVPSLSLLQEFPQSSSRGRAWPRSPAPACFVASLLWRFCPIQLPVPLALAASSPAEGPILTLSGISVEPTSRLRIRAEQRGQNHPDSDLRRHREPRKGPNEHRGAVTAALTKATFKPSWNGPDSSSLSQLTYSDLFQVIIYSRVYFYINIFSFHRSSLQSVLVADNIFEEENIKDFNIRLNQVASNLERLEYLKPRRGKMLLKNKNVDEFIKLYK